MIEITIKGYEIKVEGHAGYAEEGKDIVCSAVSTLVQTLASSLRGMGSCLASYGETMHNGKAWIKCTPRECSRESVDTIYKTIITGLKGVAKAYPDHVIIL